MRSVSTYIAGIFLLLAISACGQKDNSKKKEPTTETKTFEHLIPGKPQGWISDFEHVFTPDEIKTLDSLITQHKKETSNEIAVVTLSLDSTIIRTINDFEQFSLALFKAWGVGEKNKNNGVGILLSTQLRKVRIEVGYGLENKLMDDEAKKIIDEIMLPHFKNGDYFTGIKAGLEAVLKEIE